MNSSVKKDLIFSFLINLFLLADKILMLVMLLNVTIINYIISGELTGVLVGPSYMQYLGERLPIYGLGVLLTFLFLQLKRKRTSKSLDFAIRLIYFLPVLAILAFSILVVVETYLQGLEDPSSAGWGYVFVFGLVPSFLVFSLIYYSFVSEKLEEKNQHKKEYASLAEDTNIHQS